MKTHPTCTFPVIPPDLRREETICLIADAFDYLEATVNNIMGRLNDRVEQNRKKLKEIDRRCAVAQAKIEKLKGNKKAIKIFCSAKYPATEDFTFYSSVYPHQSSFSEMKLSNRRFTSKHPNPDDHVMTEKLQFSDFHFNEHSKRSLTGEGLGRLPRDCRFVSSLLLFNTSENPYQRYVMSDPLRGVSKMKKNLENEDDDDAMGSAPLSILQREQLDHQIGENYFYSPGLGQVPEIDVPLDLPDLPGIANDLAYSADIGPAIAPSLPLTNYPTLPEILPEVPNVAVTFPSHPPKPAKHVPPPPPEVLLPSIPVSNTTSNLPSAPLAPPPPPPPPPPVEELPQPTKDNEPKAKPIGGAPKEVTNPGDARANLLESIRQAGGKKKLRDVKDRKIEAKKKKEEAKVSGGPEFMEELFSKLLMRRRGISGARGTENQPDGATNPGSAIEKFLGDDASASPKTSISEEGSEEDWD